MEAFIFFVFAALTLAGAFGVVLARNPVHAALSLVVTLVSVAVLFIQQDAHLLAAVQVVVYAGAIVVLFLFVIMLLGVDRIDVRSERLWLQRPIAIVLAIGFVLEVGAAVRAGVGFAAHAPVGFEALQPAGNTQAVAEVLFRDYFFPFEATSILLIVAAIAAMVLAQRKVRAITQAELGEELEDEAADDVEPEIEVTP